jgi:hypothetical protein
MRIDARNRRNHFGMTRAALVMNPSISEMDVMEVYGAAPP